MNKYLKFEYWNTCDLGDIYYQGGQHFIFYLDADVGEPLHEEVEEGQENGDGDFIPTYRRQIKRYRIRTGLIPDFLIDAIQRMKLHDNIELTFKTGEIEKIYNVDIETEWQFEKYAWQGTITLTFDMNESITVGACCDNLVLDDIEPIPEFYWISPLGSDATGDGSNLRPWATLAYACTQAVSVGDVIHVAAGTYNVSTVVDLPVGVSIMGEGETTIINSTYVATYHNGVINAKSASGNAVDGAQSISYIRFDGGLTGTRAIEIDFRSNVTVHHCTFIDFLYSGVTVYGTNQNWNVTPTNTVPTGIKIYDCDFINCTQLSGHLAPGHIRLEGTRGAEIYNNTFDQTGRAAGENHDIFVAYQNYGLKVYNNVWTKNPTNGSAWNFFAEQHYTLGGFELTGNTFNGAACWDLSGVVKDAYTFGALVEENTFTNVGIAPAAAHDEPYIDLESFDYENDIIVRRNLFRNGRTGIKLGNVQTSTDNVRISYNIFENIGNSTDNWGFAIFIHSYYDGVAKPMSNIYVDNNTMDAATEAFAGVGIWMMGDITNLNIRNNIINGNFEDHAVVARLQSPAASATIAGLNITNNNYYGGAGNSFYHVAGITITDEVNSDNITTDPTFIGGSPYDYHLQAGSDCIDAGIDVGLTIDYDGVAVDDPPNIGAYE